MTRGRLNIYLCKHTKHPSKWEVILLVTMALAMLFCSWLSWRQTDLASRVLRLHVIANSDSEEDQALKLQVRDAVLTRASGYLEGVTDVEQAADILTRHLDELSGAGQAVVEQEGLTYQVTARLEECHFPTKTYEGFALPAGNYRALRVVIGAGEGHNWWCVVYPSLCITPASEFSEVAVSGGMNQEDISLMTGEDEGYVLRFKCLELWDQVRQYFAN